MLLEGKTALVTGAAKGVGRGVAIELAREGCDVAVNDFVDSLGAEPPRPRSAAWAPRIPRSGRRWRGSGVDRMFEAALGQFPRLDILVNNAAFKPGKGCWSLKSATGTA